MASVEQDLYDEAKTRVKKRRDLGAHVVAYVLVNAMLIGIWALTDPGGYFWPAWVLLGWGVGLLMNVWDVYFRRPITRGDIEREMSRIRDDS